MVQRAFISGVTPVFIWVYTLIGKVDSLGPLIKILITTSSMDMANASKDPDTTAGMIKGSVISKNARMEDAPRSLAASSRDGSIPTSLAFTSISI